jgi:hypothetical protein
MTSRDEQLLPRVRRNARLEPVRWPSASERHRCPSSPLAQPAPSKSFCRATEALRPYSRYGREHDVHEFQRPHGRSRPSDARPAFHQLRGRHDAASCVAPGSEGMKPVTQCPLYLRVKRKGGDLVASQMSRPSAGRWRAYHALGIHWQHNPGGGIRAGFPITIYRVCECARLHWPGVPYRWSGGDMAGHSACARGPCRGVH